jgi:hypothetical protein
MLDIRDSARITWRFRLAILSWNEHARLNFFSPVLRWDFFHRDGNRLFPVLKRIHYIFGDGFSEPTLLRLRFSRPKFYDDVWHGCLLNKGIILIAAERMDSPIIGQ